MKTNILANIRFWAITMVCLTVLGVGNAWGYTVTFSTGSGNPTVDAVAEASNNAGITLPAGVTPVADGWVFVGWATASCSESTKAPVLYLAGTEEYKPGANATMYAVYRKYTSGTSSVTFNAANISNLTAHPVYSRDWTDNTAGIDLYLSAGQRYTDNTPNTWTVTKSTSPSTWNFAMITAYRKIKQIDVEISGTSYKIDDADDGVLSDNDDEENEKYAMTASSPTAVSPYTQTITYTGDVSGDVTQVWMYSTTSQQIRAKTIEVTYYNAKFSSEPCDNIVSLSYNSAGSSNVSAMTFSTTSVATCSSTAGDREVTVTVTPSTGYFFKSGDRLTWTKSSGTIPSDPTYVSGPTLSAGKYEFVYRFAQSDNGAGTFAATSSTYTNYRTICCTELGEIDGDVNITTDGCDPGEIKVTWKMEATTGIASQTLRVYDENVDEVTAKRITSITPSTSNQTKTISGLDPCKDYFVTIENVSSGGAYCAAGAPWTSDVVTTLGYTYTVNATNCQLKSTSDPVPSDMCEGDVLVYYEATGGSTLPDAITVTNAGAENTGWAWDSSDGSLMIDADYVTGDVEVTIFASCPGFSFHYGNDGDAANLWTITCFGDAVSNVRTIEDFEIPSKTHFYVGYQGTYTAGNSDATNKPNSSTLTWSSLYFDASIGDGTRPMVGQATGATGTVKIIDNSDWTNKKASFIPDGYKLKFGSSTYSDFVQYNGHEYRSGLVEYNSTSADYNVSVGVINANDDDSYVATANSVAMRHLFLRVDANWASNSAKFSIYSIDGSAFKSGFMVAVPGETNLYEGWIAADCDEIIFVRHNGSAGSPSWDEGNKWNQTGDLTLETGKNLFTIDTSSDWNGQTDGWSTYARNGKFRMNEDWTDKNWYVRYVPYNVLTYDKNNVGASGTMAVQSVAADAVSKSVTVSANGFTAPTGYHFDHWDTEYDGDGDDYDPSDSYTLSADATLYAIWAPNTNTPYTVKHYKQKLDGTYPASPDDTDNLTGTTGASITPARKSYTGFTAPSGTTTTILADGSRVVEYQYSRNSYTLAWSLDGGSIDVAGTTAGSVKYEASLTAPTVSKTGYTFNAWSPSVPSTMPAANSTYTATWTANTNTAYTVKHYKQKLDGTYPASPDETDNLTGTTATSVTPARKSYTGFTAPDAQTETILADGSLVITYNYTRNKYNVAVASVGDVTITATPSGGSAIAEGSNDDAEYNSTVTLNYSSLGSGLTWGGWRVCKADDASTTVSVSGSGDGATFTMPAYDVKVTAIVYSVGIAWCDPEIEVTGDIHLTSYKNIPVYATSGADNLIEISSSDFGSATRLDVAYLDADDSDAEVDKAESVFRLCNDGSVNYDPIDGFDLDYEWGTTHSVRYIPNAFNHRDNYKLQFTLKRGDKVLKTVTHSIYGRALPEEFVIASKYLGHWYALPNTMGTATETVTPIQITVDNATTPTEASYAPSTTVYKGAARKTATSNRNSIRLTNDGSHWLITNNSDAKLGLSATETEGYENREVWYLKSSTFGAYELAMDPAQSPTKKLGMYNGNMGVYADPAYTSEDIYLLPIDTKYTPIDATATDWMKDIIGVTASTSATKMGIAKENGTEYAAVTLASVETNHIADFDGEIDFTGLTGEKVLLKWYDGSTLVGGSQVTVPSIILAGSNTSWSALETAIERSTTLDDIVVLTKPMTVGDAHAKAKQIVMDKSGDNTGKLTVQANKGLEVAGTVKVYNGSAFGATTAADLILESSSSEGNASLIFDNSNGDAATVQMYSKAGVTDFGTKDAVWNWQYVGTPFTGEIPLYNYYGSWMYKWYNGGWSVVHGTDELDPFAGYCLTQESGTTHVMDGTLVATDGNDIEIDMAASTDMVIANSWTAPIYIGGFTAETFTSAPATIYLFNTGSATKESGGASEGTTEPGTYNTVPVNSGPYFGVELIPSMQGFFVTTNGVSGKAGTITLKYDELVRPDGYRGSIVTGQMYAPRRENKPEVMKIWANGSEYNDRVVILAREDFSEGFDNGWDGAKLSFGNESPSVYVINEEGGYDAVSAIPEYEGTLVGFRAGSEDNVYTMTFEYNGDEVLYLNDLKAQMSAEIANGQTYTFTTEDGDSEFRFIISHNPIRRITTGVDEVVSGTKVRKIIINDKLFIIRGGRMFSADGQLVK